MARSASTSFLGRELEDFLYSSIGEDHDGMQLSVLSALARLNVDPWAEATALAELPEKKATQRLTSLIAKLPNESSVHRDAGTIAARLIALLPARTGPHRLLSQIMAHDVQSPGGSRALRYGMLLGALMSAQWMVTSCQPPARIDNDRPSTSSTMAPDVSSNSGQ